MTLKPTPSLSRQPQQRTFQKVLVANRGEIARRVFRTLHKMGIASVAVFSDADRQSSWLDSADEAVFIGPAAGTESYLNIDAVVDAAHKVAADAIHPGYGFLSENAELARRCAAEGIVFIGPTPGAIDAMGRKDRAKQLAREAEVPVLEGFAIPSQSSQQLGDDEHGHDDLVQKARKLGFPLLIKAVAGGGGKAMEVVHEEQQLAMAIASARRQGENAFGSGELIAERYLPAARHVEIQIIADHHGRTVHLLERDCSVQRRRQKVLEECPSPVVNNKLRRRMAEAAIRLARKVGYQNVGTVELLLLPESREFYFLEMNTRLQVEHAVTEMVTGVDLVELQVRIAQGEPLPPELQDEVEPNGHAVEARLYAEDPNQDFLPAAGSLTLWQPPKIRGLRIDSGVAAGDSVSIHYDPLLAKLIAHGADRHRAVQLLKRGLRQLAVAGPATNRDFLIRLLDEPSWQAGEAHIHWLGELPPEIRQPLHSRQTVELHAVAAVLLLRSQSPPSGRQPWPAAAPKGWRLIRRRPQEYSFESPIGPLTVDYLPQPGNPGAIYFEIRSAVADPSDPSPRPETPRRSAGIVGRQDESWKLEIDGVRRLFTLHLEGSSLQVHGLGEITTLNVLARFPQRTVAGAAAGCLAPMTGRVVEVLAEAGQEVEKGQTLVVLEAMKMEHRLQAHVDGIVTQVHVSVGDTVDPDQVMIDISDPVGAEND